MEKSTNLKLLDLSHNMLTTVPVGTIACLTNLEYLDMRRNFELKFIGDVSTQFEEILSNERLIDLFIDVDNSACTIETTNTLLDGIKKLKNLELSIGLGSSTTSTSSKQVILKKIHVWAERMEWLFASMNAITFTDCQGLGTIFEKLVANSYEVGCFDTLRVLYISGCTDWVEVGSNAKFDMLPNLKDISLIEFTNISCILDFALPLGLKFSRLERIRVIECSQLKYFLSLGSTIPALEKLGEVILNYCDQVEELFKFDQNSGFQDATVFPNLKTITLKNCPRLRFLSELNIGCPRLEVVEVENCPLLKKFPFTAQNVGTIKTITCAKKWWDELEWENDDIKNLYTPVLHLY
ncbi:UNVERIFIED_CONTAM: hypothetical protein Sradi_0542200 [Sesamum radiatum]|uniref:Disease resistance protein At4g27190-like leucine-rich repeats domain-containing protein n=1 Tax=Sesamum radiatum TaxID=300843 RepID=A0AAW2VI42_SESRA